MQTDLVTLSHGAAKLGWAIVDAYNVELRDQHGFVGDRANKQAFLAVDIGGTNLRPGLVALEPGERGRNAVLVHAERWRHVEEQPSRDAMVQRLAMMLRALAALAVSRQYRLAPVVGVGCPGVIRADGGIERGAQNLPGAWDASAFNLPRALEPMLPRIAGQTSRVVLHNDAVVQGLSEAPWMRDTARWGVLTIGTGLGNARFSRLVGAAC